MVDIRSTHRIDGVMIVQPKHQHPYRAVARALTSNHSRAISRLILLNHSRAVARALTSNHSRAVAAAGRA